MSDDNDISTRLKREQGRIVICRTQDVEPYLEANKRRANEYKPRRNSVSRMVADIPNIVVEKWLKEGFNIFQASEKELRKKLDERDYQYLKQIPGKVGQRSRHI